MIIPDKCIYCGEIITNENESREHIIPDCLGGSKILKENLVCKECNNGILSNLANALLYTPHIQIVTVQDLRIKSAGGWDFNSETGIVLEAHFSEDKLSQSVWPQIIIHDDDVSFFTSSDDINLYGEENCLRIFHKYLRNSYEEKKENCVLFDELKSKPRFGLYPPRIFTKHAISSLKGDCHFICRYYGVIDKHNIIERIKLWEVINPNYRSSMCIGSQIQQFSGRFNGPLFLRSLVMLGINLLAHYCKITKVNKDTFKESILFIIEGKGINPAVFRDCGFVANDDLQRLNCPDETHKFRLTFDNGWVLICSFFGGKVGTRVCFPGPNYEDWRRIDIEAPINSTDWRKEESLIIKPDFRCITDINNIKKIIPSSNIENFETMLVQS